VGRVVRDLAAIGDRTSAGALGAATMVDNGLLAGRVVGGVAASGDRVSAGALGAATVVDRRQRTGRVVRDAVANTGDRASAGGTATARCRRQLLALPVDEAHSGVVERVVLVRTRGSEGITTAVNGDSATSTENGSAMGGSDGASPGNCASTSRARRRT
jgi:hypothetical protein